MLLAAVREGQKEFGKRVSDKRSEHRQDQGPRGTPRGREKEQPVCFYCGGKGHMKRECRKRMADEKIWKED